MVWTADSDSMENCVELVDGIVGGDALQQLPDINCDHAVTSVHASGAYLTYGCGYSGRFYVRSLERSDGLVYELDVGSKDDVTAICSVSDNKWLLGCGSELVFCQLNSGYLCVLDRLTVSDEINAIDANATGSQAAVSDDLGIVTIVGLKYSKLVADKVLKGHDSLCTCVRFRPNAPRSLLSGGLDHKLILWNLNTKKIVASLNMADALNGYEEPEDAKVYSVNPPLIHCLDLTPDGLVCVAGLDNGKVVVTSIGGKGLQVAHIVSAHYKGISCLVINPDLTIITASNDRHISQRKLSTAKPPSAASQVALTPLRHCYLKEKPCCIAVNHSKRTVYIADESRTISCWSYEANVETDSITI